MVKHKKQKCNVRGCKEGASRWFGTDKLSGDFDMKGKHTFFMCYEHCEKLSSMSEGEEVLFLNPENGRIRSIEIGVYSCHEDCMECNCS